MTRDKTEAALRHMLDYAREAQSLAQGKSREDIDTDRLLNLSLARLLEILGESANRVSPDRRERHSDIPWRKIIDMRNRLIHGYDIIDLDVVWNTVTEDLCPLIEALEKMLPKED